MRGCWPQRIGRGHHRAGALPRMQRATPRALRAPALRLAAPACTWTARAPATSRRHYTLHLFPCPPQPRAARPLCPPSHRVQRGGQWLGGASRGPDAQVQIDSDALSSLVQNAASARHPTHPPPRPRAVPRAATLAPAQSCHRHQGPWAGAPGSGTAAAETLRAGLPPTRRRAGHKPLLLQAAPPAPPALAPDTPPQVEGSL